jgi:peroxin-13
MAVAIADTVSGIRDRIDLSSHFPISMAMASFFSQRRLAPVLTLVLTMALPGCGGYNGYSDAEPMGYAAAAAGDPLGGAFSGDPYYYDSPAYYGSPYYYYGVPYAYGIWGFPY